MLAKIANDLRLIAATYLGSLLLAALLFSWAEPHSFTESLWWANVTATTIGYGDVAPTTTQGRLIAGCFQIFWVFGITPLVVVNIMTRVLENRDQFSHEEQEEIKRLLTEIHTKLKENQ